MILLWHGFQNLCLSCPILHGLFSQEIRNHFLSIMENIYSWIGQHFSTKNEKWKIGHDLSTKRWKMENWAWPVYNSGKYIDLALDMTFTPFRCNLLGSFDMFLTFHNSVLLWSFLDHHCMTFYDTILILWVMLALNSS